jgi:uncharacterized RDD family membrane protein YckC
MPQWSPAADVQGLFPAATAAAPVATLDYATPLAAANDPRDPTTSPFYTGRPSEVIYAGFFLRFLAYLVDGVILLAIAIPVLLGFVWIIGGADEITPAALMGAFKNIDGNPAAGLLLRLVLMGVAWLYFAYQESSAAQATLGKRFLGLVVTDTSGRRISFARASGRHFGKIISGMILSIGYAMARFTERKQALHDMMAGCLVVLKPS